MPDTGRTLRGEYSQQLACDTAFPVLTSTGADAQQRIEAVPDGHWAWKQSGEPPILQKAGHLLVTAVQSVSSARLTAVASDTRYVGQAFMPVTGLNVTQAKAGAVFLNSTAGRLLIMRHPGKMLAFPTYSPAAWLSVGVPDLTDKHIVSTLADCWEETRNETVPQYRDGHTGIRRLWDVAVCAALGWDLEAARIDHG